MNNRRRVAVLTKLAQAVSGAQEYGISMPQEAPNASMPQRDGLMRRLSAPGGAITPRTPISRALDSSAYQPGKVGAGTGGSNAPTPPPKQSFMDGLKGTVGAGLAGLGAGLGERRARGAEVRAGEQAELDKMRVDAKASNAAATDRFRNSTLTGGTYSAIAQQLRRNDPERFGKITGQQLLGMYGNRMIKDRNAQFNVDDISWALANQGNRGGITSDVAPQGRAFGGEGSGRSLMRPLPPASR